MVSFLKDIRCLTAILRKWKKNNYLKNNFKRSNISTWTIFFKWKNYYKLKFANYYIFFNKHSFLKLCLPIWWIPIIWNEYNWIVVLVIWLVMPFPPLTSLWRIAIISPNVSFGFVRVFFDRETLSVIIFDDVESRMGQWINKSKPLTCLVPMNECYERVAPIPVLWSGKAISATIAYVSISASQGALVPTV